MNNELLKLFDNPDDAVEELQLIIKIHFMKSASGSNLQEPAVPDAIAFILSEKETKKDLLYQYLSTTDLLELSLT